MEVTIFIITEELGEATNIKIHHIETGTQNENKKKTIMPSFAFYFSLHPVLKGKLVIGINVQTCLPGKMFHTWDFSSGDGLKRQHNG